MEWKSLNDKMPDNNLQIIACIDGVYRIGKINPDQLVFEEDVTNEFYSLKNKVGPIYWTEIQTPNHPQ